MTAPAPETLEREREKLFVTDAELIRRLGVPEKQARPLLRMLSKRSDFPKKRELFGNRRYMPEVQTYIERLLRVNSNDRRG